MGRTEKSVEGFDVEIEPRRKLGLPVAVMAQAGLKPGDRMNIEVKRDGRLNLVPLTELLDKYSGAVPGLASAGPDEPGTK
jgi:bifunctional DNA-binding transcriptional regulator/antitoxin component of YhaV-PrlF toxin-antitoxin module